MISKIAKYLLAGLVLRIAIAFLLPPGYDEAYYLFYGHHLAASYYDHPIMVGLWAWMGLQLPGDSLGLRIPSLVSYTIASFLLALAANKRLSTGAGAWTAAITALSPLLVVVGGVMLLPDAPLLITLSAVIWALAVGLSWGWLGLLLGLLTLSKYQAFPLLICLLLWALSQAQTRRRLFSWEGAQAFGGWLLVSSPLWLWNMQNGWISFLFHNARTQGDGGFNFSGPPLFLLTQQLALFPSFGLLLLVGLMPQKADRHSDFRRLLRWLAIPQLVLFLLLSGRMQVLVSWLVPTWWLLVPLAAERVAQAQARGFRWFQPWLWFSAVLPPALMLIAASHVRFGIGNAFIPTKLDTSRELFPPSRLRDAIQKQPMLWHKLKTAKLLVGQRYYEPGLLALALGNDTTAMFTTLNRDSRGFAFWLSEPGLEGRDGILFRLTEPTQDKGELEIEQQLGQLTLLAVVDMPRGNQAGQKMEFFSFSAYKPSQQNSLRKTEQKTTASD